MDSEPSIADIVLHPVRLRIVQQLGGRQLTTAALREELPDITQATLYRHVAALIAAQIVTVVDERRVRGTIERTLALGERMAHVGQDDLDAMSDAELRNAFLSFLAPSAKDSTSSSTREINTSGTTWDSARHRSTSPPKISWKSRRNSPNSSSLIGRIATTAPCALR